MQEFTQAQETAASEFVHRLQALRQTLPPELAKAARFILENNAEVGLSSIRKLAVRAGVKPNAFIRLAHSTGFSSFEKMRDVFREELRNGPAAFPDRARWLQSISQRGELGQLYSDIAEQLSGNLGMLFTKTSHVDLHSIAQDIIAAERTFVLGVGIANAAAQNFSYVASMAIDNVYALPNGGMLPADRLAHANENDLLIAVTFHPYRTEVIEAVKLALALGVQVVAISDRYSSPIMVGARRQVVIPVDTSKFFTSTVALTAFFETLVAFVVAEAGDDVAKRIESFHKQRESTGVYAAED